MSQYVLRTADALIADYLADLPAVLVIGPRACGKTTTARRYARTVVRLDSDEAAAFRANPDAALRERDEPVLLDEWQMVPDVLGAVKRAVDTDRRPGRFLITGSFRSDRDDRFWPGTGRVVVLRMYPLSVAEQRQRTQSTFIDRVVTGEPLSAGDRAPDGPAGLCGARGVWWLSRAGSRAWPPHRACVARELRRPDCLA